MSMASSTNSSENLTTDERLILQSGVRNEPQGEESKSPSTNGYDICCANSPNGSGARTRVAGTNGPPADCSHLHQLIASLPPRSLPNQSSTSSSSSLLPTGANTPIDCTTVVTTVCHSNEPPSSSSPSSSSSASSSASAAAGCSLINIKSSSNTLNPLYENSFSLSNSNGNARFSTVLELPKCASSTSNNSVFNRSSALAITATTTSTSSTAFHCNAIAMHTISTTATGSTCNTTTTIRNDNCNVASIDSSYTAPQPSSSSSSSSYLTINAMPPSTDMHSRYSLAAVFGSLPTSSSSSASTVVPRHSNQSSQSSEPTCCTQSSFGSNSSNPATPAQSLTQLYVQSDHYSDPLDHYANLPFTYRTHPHHLFGRNNNYSNSSNSGVREPPESLPPYGKLPAAVAHATSLYNSPLEHTISASGSGACLNESHSSSNESRSCCSNNSKSKSNERLSIFSKSHPDLSKLDEEMLNNSLESQHSSGSSSTAPHHHHYHHYNHAQSRPFVAHRLMNVRQASPQQLYMNAMQLEAQKFTPLDMIKAENTFLKSELEACLKKVSKLQKFEQEIQKVHQMYEDLMQSSEKKEKLERAVRYKLEIEIKRLQQLNSSLKEQVNVALMSSSSSSGIGAESAATDAVKEELQKTDILIGQLLNQNKELASVKERQDIELQAQRLTLEEQRKHIEILDSALMNAQNNVIALEANLRKKTAYEERATHLQKALANLQLASERRLQMEKRARTQLEQEIEMLKIAANSKHGNGLGGPGLTGSMVGNEVEMESLKKLLREYEEKIISLEGEVSKWEQKYLEENTMRQIEVNAASVPKDAKIAALEKTSQQTERLIAEARNERLKHMDELHEASKRTAELEAKSKDLESKLAEKDAMIKVLQQHSMDRDTVLQQSILAQRSTLGRHTRSVSSMGLVNPGSAASKKCTTALGRNLKNLSISGTSATALSKFSERAGSTSTAPSCSSYGYSSGQSSIASSGSGSATDKKTSSNLDEQLKELDKRLTSKDSIIRALRSERERYPNHFWKV